MSSLRSSFSMMTALLVAVPLSLAMSACIVEEEPAPGPTGPVYKFPRQQDFCAAIADAECPDSLVKACYDSGDAAQAATDKAACEAKRSLPSSCNPSGFTYDPAEAEPCLASRTSIYSDASLTKDEIKADYEACLGVFSRGQSAGATCTVDIDCDTTADLRCVIGQGATAGSCAVPKIVNGGDPCGGQGEVCPDTHFCDESKNCLTRKKKGDACSPTILCGETLLCDATNVCADKASNTSPCATDAECASGFCIRQEGALPEEPGKCLGAYTFSSFSETCAGF